LALHALHSFPTRRSSDLDVQAASEMLLQASGDVDQSVHNMQTRTGAVTRRASEADRLAHEAAEAAEAGANLVADVQNGMESIAEDRKSTRLNSSHVAISY